MGVGASDGVGWRGGEKERGYGVCERGIVVGDVGMTRSVSLPPSAGLLPAPKARRVCMYMSRRALKNVERGFGSKTVGSVDRGGALVPPWFDPIDFNQSSESTTRHEAATKPWARTSHERMKSPSRVSTTYTSHHIT